MFEENRTEPRERLALPLTLADGSSAVTRDISASGLYFETAAPGPADEHLVFEMQMPDSPLRFMAEGEVVRRERRNGVSGVAVRLIDPRLESDE